MFFVLRRHSLSNHVWLKDILLHRLFLVLFIFRHRFAVVVIMTSTASR